MLKIKINNKLPKNTAYLVSGPDKKGKIHIAEITNLGVD